MHLLSPMNGMIDFILNLPIQLRGTRNKGTLQKLFIVGFETSHGNVSSLQVRRLNHTANLGCYEWRN